MNLFLLIIVALAIIGGAFYCSAKAGTTLGHRVAVNSKHFIHEDGRLTRIPEAAFATRYLLTRPGTDPAKQVLVCGANTEPSGIMMDEATDDDVTEANPRAVATLGNTPGTLPLTISAAVAAEAKLYTTGDGKVGPLPAGAGTYYLVGIAKQSGSADGDIIEVAHCRPEATVVS